ncbi:transglycosylase domain-containing protein [Paenibacillus sp. GCM10012306]|uniref:transglycosylase domain-containing protein n=1 Tax=Paenibacillus sp. GCM10012306 TaxID=3317342 RepID=UPI00361FBD25
MRARVMRILYLLFDLGVLAVLLMLAGLVYIHEYGSTVVSRYPDKLILPESSVMLAADGSLMRRVPLPGSGYRSSLQLAEVPKLLTATFLAVEDRRFYIHEGLDYKGILRALVTNATNMEIAEGGSSITQQLARNLYLNRDKNLLRKVNEASIALELERRLSKSEILELYLNQLYMGRGQYGIKAAAERYFGITDLKKLEIWQIATLAAIPKGPSIYNPVDDPKRSAERRELVLRIMEQRSLISHAQMNTALLHKYQAPSVESQLSAVGISYGDAALQEAARLTGKSREELQSGGYTIVTAMNVQVQSVLEKAFSQPNSFPPDGKDRQVEAAMVIMDHHNGEVVALMGGREPKEGGLNRAIMDARQPGSSFKPIIDYGPALESGKFTPDSLLSDQRAAYGSYQPENLNGNYRGQVTMQTAIKQSINAPAVWLLQQVGIGQARKFATKLGIELTEEDNNLAIALGGLHKGISPLKMAQAYSVFANGGKYNEGHLVRMVKNARGEVIYKYTSASPQVISPVTADRMTTMLRSVVNEGTGKKAQMNRPVAGKTGTTQLDLPGVSRKGNRDLWFVGYTPEWTGAVWIGFDRTDEHNYMTAGSGTAAALFSKIMSQALAKTGK